MEVGQYHRIFAPHLPPIAILLKKFEVRPEHNIPKAVLHLHLNDLGA